MHFEPKPNFSGEDGFTYKAFDGELLSEQFARVRIVVRPVNDAPVAVNDSYTVAEDTVLTVSVAGVLANDSDVENDALSAILVSEPGHGSLGLNADGSFSYTPAANFNGADSFTYKANDGALDSVVATVSITVTS